jgi:hypothetical protein
VSGGGGRLQARRAEEQQPSTTVAPPAAPASNPPATSAASVTPQPPAETPEQRFARAAQAMSRAAQRMPGDLAGLSSPLPPLPTVSDVRPGDRRPTTPGGVVESAAAAAGVTRETQLDEAAVRLAEELRVIPGIERFGATRLGDLDRSGPRALRTLWRIARDRLDTRYGDMTIGALIDRLNDQGPGGPSA